MRLDWKYIVTMLAAIAGVVAPIWLWQLDLRAKSLTVRLASSVAIQSPEASSIPDLQLMVGGVKIESPVLSTLELINDGAKPIPAADFESALELAVGSPSKIVRTRVSKVEPDDLKAELDTSSQVIKLKPLLLNPNDKITIAVLTSGSTPAFLPRARIAGISTIKFDNSITPEPTWKPIAMNAALGTAGLVLYFIFATFISATFSSESPTIRLGRTLTLCTMLVLALFSAIASSRVFALAAFERNLANAAVLLAWITAIAFGVRFQVKKRFSDVEPDKRKS